MFFTLILEIRPRANRRGTHTKGGSSYGEKEEKVEKWLTSPSGWHSCPFPLGHNHHILMTISAQQDSHWPLISRTLRERGPTSVFLFLCPLASPTKAGCFNCPLLFLVGSSWLDPNHSHSVNMASNHLPSSFLSLKTNFPTTLAVFPGDPICGQGHANSVFLVNYNGDNWHCLLPMSLPIICASRIFFLSFSASIVKTHFVVLILCI